MCGIAAVISPRRSRAELSKIVDLTRALEHRGDKAPKTQIYEAFALGCARLAIVDRMGGAQPFCDDDHRYSIVFNGEIYNHTELRQQLTSEGSRFRTKCDTEVLLHGFKKWAIDLPKHLDGMYAFIVIDRQEGTFFAARDPFGIKPLYYRVAGDTWYLSSEIAPLIDGSGAVVKSLPPGSLIVNGAVRERVNYKDLSPLNEADMPIEKAIHTTRSALRDSVRRHLPPADLRTAIFCSGGIDSSALLLEAVNACRDFGHDPKNKLAAYCVGSATSEDQKFASDLAWQLGVPYFFEEIHVEDMIESIPRAIETMETYEPNHIRAGTTSLALARRVHDDNIKVALLGEGADELFGGYEEFPNALKTGGVQEVERLLRLFTSQLHRTQLRRVDRTTMAFGIEARVPFLDRRFTDHVLQIPTEHKVRRLETGSVIGKHVLREAYRGDLPDRIVDRRKVPMGEGAGVGDNRAVGPFHEFCERAINDERFQNICAEFAEFNLKNKEEAHYFDLFSQRFGRLALATERPYTNVAKTT
ncbi:MAG: asparagine synthase-related protein [Acidobacteria bacterium]|nr:asparagine synthase-related protein [Acidobacteriota bacterium]